MEEELVTIIVPCYNGAERVHISLDSILKQTYKKLQIIFVDDGSTDATKNIVSKYQDKFKKEGMEYVYIFQENQGVGAAVANALKYIKGEFLTLLDADDYLMVDSIRKRVEYLEGKKEFGIVRTNGYYCSEDMLEDKSRLFVNDYKEMENEFIYEDLILGRTNNWSGSYMIRTKYLMEAYQNKNFYPSRYGQNMQLLVPVAKCYKSGFINEPLMKYIQWNQTITRSEIVSYDKQKKMYEGFQDIRVQLLNQFDNNNDQLKDRVNEMYDHIFLKLAYQLKKREDVYFFYDKLKKKKQLRSEDKIYYYYTKGNIFKFIAMVCSKFHIW